MTPSKITARIEVFRTGTFKPMVGDAVTYSTADLKAMADVYDYDTAPAPIVVGHPQTDAPAFGWAESFEYDATADRLYANVGDINPAFADAVKKGSYKKISLSFFAPTNAANPVPGTWYPKHIGFLGGAAPAVTGLKNVQFSAPAADVPTFTSEFGEPGFEQTASIIRSLRDWMIDKFGIEDADKALPAYQIEWLSDTQVIGNPSPAYAAPPQPKPKEEPAVSNPNPAFAAREADLAAREERIKARERETANAANVAFAESLVADGKLIPDSKDRLVAIMNALPIETSVSFAAGQAAVPVAQALREILAAQPKVVSYGKLDLPAGGGERVASFASDGKQVDQAKLELHGKATAYQRAHPGMAYLDAVRAVSEG